MDLQKNMRPDLKHAGFLFSLSLIMLYFIGGRVQNQNIHIGIIITEYIFILLPVFIYLKIHKMPIKETLRLYKVKKINYLLITLLMLFTLPVVSILNIFNLWAIKSIFGRVVVVSVPMTPGFLSFLLSVFTIGVSAAVCEEALFRGVIQRSMGRFGAKTAILVTALLFGLMHLDFQRLLGTFLLGALIGFIVYRTGSLYAGIAAHFVNNTVIVIMSYSTSWLFGNMVSENVTSSGDDVLEFFNMLESVNGPQQIITIAIWIIMLLVFASILAGLIIAFLRTTSVNETPPRKESFKYPQLIWFVPGIITAAYVYILIAQRL